MVEAFGDRWPFVILTVLCFVVLSLGVVIRYHFALPVHTHASVFGLLKEQKIFVTALIIFLANLPISALETGQPLWIGIAFQDQRLLLKGLSFLPTTLGYLLASNFIALFFDWFGGLVTTSAIGIGSTIFASTDKTLEAFNHFYT